MAKQVKTETVEYRLLITKTYDDTIKKDGIRFHLETTKQFTNFAYVIDIHDTLEKSSLVWSLHGLRAPSMNMPTTGTAQFDKVYFDLPKKINFTFAKKGNLKVSTEIKFLKHEFKVSKNAIGFLKIYLTEQEFEANRVTDLIAPELKPDVHRASKPQSPKK